MLTGDVMCGRGIDQIMPYHNPPLLYEPWIRDAREYIHIAEEVHGAIPRHVGFDYIWGESLKEMEKRKPHVRIINLETSITISNSYWPAKGINYRMHPVNTPILKSAQIDCCALANNHVLDWDRPGLEETLQSLHNEGIRYAGAGKSKSEAFAPAVLNTEHGRVLFFSVGFGSSGVPSQWAATEKQSGVAFFREPSDAVLEEMQQLVRRYRKEDDVVLFSLHWGDNWDYSVYPEEQRFAHGLIDVAGVDVVHGHSSHHLKGIEVHNDRLILYGCGDLINDYEGIGGNEMFRGDLSALYFASINSRNGTLAGLEVVPFTMEKFSLRKVEEEDMITMNEIFNREGRKLGTAAELKDTDSLLLKW
ncbi:MAG: CapA family protein [Chitinispirillaceae bacterium]